MYARFFGLQREPFSIAPDPHFLFMSEAHREALAHLLYGVAGGGGFVLLTGEIGAGKTTVCRAFLDQIPPKCDVAYVFNPKLSVLELLQTVCEEFAVALPPGTASVKQYVDGLNAFLLRSHAAGRHSVLIIDEAQSLSAELLEQLRLLTNLETAERKLLQIVLIGQPELRDLLARPDLEQLAQRVIARYHLPALAEAESLQYVRHRLAVAGLAGEMPFDTGALRRLHALCRGVPRRLNLLADRALLGAYASGRTRVDRHTVERAAQEVFGKAPAAVSRRPWAWAGGLAAVATAGAVAAGWAWQQRPANMAAEAVAIGPEKPASTAASAAVTAPGGTASAGAEGAASTLGAAVQAASAQPAATGPAQLGGGALASPAAPNSDGAALLARALSSETAAWRELGAMWRLDLSGADPCEAAARLQAACYRSSSGLAGIGDLGRPGILTLRDGQDRPLYALLTALRGEQATLVAAGVQTVLPLPALAAVWRGDFATLWQTPPGFGQAGDNTGAAVGNWLARSLPPSTQPLRERVLAFQIARGLKPDGLAGPLTLMHINRSSGLDEPRLAVER